jgi:hypothetical protein
MSINEVLAELPTMSVAERQLLVRKAIEFDDSPLSAADEAEVERRRQAQREYPDSAVTLDEMKSRLRDRFEG